MMKGDENASLEPSAYPLIAYVHVPKTAGTTVRRILDICTPRGSGRVQTLIKDRKSLVDFARNSDWIGGHVPRDNMASGLIWLDRPIEYFSTVREPVAQLVSHLNFSFERKNNHGDYYTLYNRREHLLDAEVMSTDFSDPAAVIALLLRRPRHYLNAQSRYVLGADFADISDAEMARRLASYTYVASENDLLKLYRTFGFAQLPEGVDEIRENVAKPYIGANVFDSPQLQEFLAFYHQHDFRLYSAVRSASWPAAGRRPFRPALLGQVVTTENFDEQHYLDSNPDVASAIEEGRFESGRAHFDLHGFEENRRARSWVLPPAAVSEQTSTEVEFSASSALDRVRRLRDERRRTAEEAQLRQQERTKRATA
jgi:hypothetical protein